jgi:hypothetical protein
MGSSWEPDTKTDWPNGRRSKLNFSFDNEFSLPSAQRYIWATLFLGDVNTGIWPSSLG